MSTGDRNLNILLVEDDPDYAFLIMETLLDHGIRSIHAESLTDAKDHMADSQFDVILLDLGLPDTGLTPAWEDVRECDSVTPIIVLTGRDDDEMAGRAIRTGAQDYVIKSEHLGSDLARAINYAIERQRVMQEMQEARDEAIAATASAMKLAETQSSVALLGQSLTQSLDLDTMLHESGPIIRQLLPAKRIVINLADKETGTYITKFVHGREIQGLSTGGVRVLKGSVTEHVMETRAPMVIADELRQPPSEDSVSLSVLEDAGIRSGLVVPLVVGEEATGTIVWFDDDPDHFDDRDLDLAITISVQIAGALVNAELHDRTLRLEKEKVERSRLEYENKRLEAANEMSAVVISNVSHELRTPLTSVLAFADNLQKNRSGALDERDLMQVRMIRHSGRQLDLLISDLLTMSRLKQGEFKMSYAEFPLEDLFAEIINVMSSIAAVKDQTISAPDNQESIVLNADRSRLYQVICNLVSNALKYSPEGSRVELEYLATDSDVSISVRDYGDGMSTEEQSEVFERFARLDNDVTRTQQGTGLGLHIVQSLVARHGGKIDLESYEGMGSVFKITIPLQPNKREIDAAA